MQAPMRSIGFDLTGDGYPDEDASIMMGMFAALSWLDREPAVVAIEAGRVLWVFDLQQCAAGELDYVRLSTYQAVDVDDDPSNNLGGEGILAAIDSPMVPAVGAWQTDGKALVSLGAAHVPLSHLLEYAGDEGPIVWLEGIALSVELEYRGDQLYGRIGAGVPAEPTEAMYYEYVPRTATRILADDPGCPDACESAVAGIIAREMDWNGDGVVDADELRESARWYWRVREIDLQAEHQGEMVHWPGHDGIADSVGVALLFAAVPVTLIH
jgi:hypothetical protein